MFHQRMQRLMMALSVLCMVSQLAYAGIPGRVTDVDDEGIVTIQTDDGEEHEVKIDGLQVGEQVDYTVQEQGMVTITTSDGREHQGKAVDIQMSHTRDCAEKNAAGECPKQ
jgi:flagellar basal body rod protein FlgF